MPNKRIETEFFELRTMIANMTNLTQSMFNDVIKAIIDQDADLAADVFCKDAAVDALDLQIDDRCLRILALYDPKAAELRYVVSVLRLIVDIERIGDHCKVMAKQVKKRYLAPIANKNSNFISMAEMAGDCLKLSVEAFFELDKEKAERVMDMATDVDSYQRKVMKELVEFITEDPANVKLGMSMNNIVRRIARVADHAQNIAEIAYYVIYGINIRHTKECTN